MCQDFDHFKKRDMKHEAINTVQGNAKLISFEAPYHRHFRRGHPYAASVNAACPEIETHCRRTGKVLSCGRVSGEIAELV